VVTPGGIVAFPRDPFTGVQVWSSEQGYPGDPVYREFYRDLGYDADFETVRECLEPDGRRRNIGLKYHRVTGRVPLDRKEPYIPHYAKGCAASHASHFVKQCERRVNDLADGMGNGPILCAMYDTELFGHWWFEGIDFLENVYRGIATSRGGVAVSTPSEILAGEDVLQSVMLCASTWGVNGYYEHWVNASNSWVYPHLHKAEDRMAELAARFPGASGLHRRALNQAARELQLAQASDWAFLIAARTAPEYATRRTRDHIAQFTRIYDMLVSERIDEGELQQIEQRDSIFSEMDYEVYAPAQTIPL
jgi:1,4-alpha-glucan branching enzyme